MKHIVAMLVSSGVGAVAWDLAGPDKVALGMMLGLIGSIIGWFLGLRLWAWMNE